MELLKEIFCFGIVGLWLNSLVDLILFGNAVMSKRRSWRNGEARLCSRMGSAGYGRIFFTLWDSKNHAILSSVLLFF